MLEGVSQDAGHRRGRGLCRPSRASSTAQGGTHTIWGPAEQIVVMKPPNPCNS